MLNYFRNCALCLVNCESVLHFFKGVDFDFFKKYVDTYKNIRYNYFCRREAKQYAGVAEQADAQDLKSCGSDTVPVRFRSSAPS